ncbi:MAG: penicillin-binding protein activator [Gammaproteobacteria bacterium]|nr:penicillin-binding protein activator [Gammaproteobacteria bacterium]
MIPRPWQLPKTALIAALAAAALSGCARLPQTPTPPSMSAQEAGKAVRHEHYMEAAQAYQRLAQQAHGRTRAALTLKAADALVRAGALDAASAELRQLKTPLTSSLAARQAVLQAEIAAASDQPARAFADADAASSLPNLKPSLLARIHRIKAQAALRLGHTQVAVRELVERESLLVSPRRLAANERALWHALALMPDHDLRTLRRQGATAGLRAWADLALRVRHYPPQSRRLRRTVSAWQIRHPQYPLGAQFLKMLGGSRPRPTALHSIAVLLPLSSPFAVAAQAVENGFVDMSEVRPLPGDPHIVIYDIGSNGADANHYYKEAVAHGAQFVVGPLGAAAVRDVTEHTRFRVPTLLLGLAPGAFAHDGGAVPVYQFSLARTLEARQAANRAYLDNHRRAAILYPDTAWGKSMRHAFARHWRHLGGLVTAEASYTPGLTNYAAPVQNLLNITQSRARDARLQRILGMPLAFTARRRQDVGFVFLVADAPDGRLIKPQLDYNHADTLPVYSTSTIFTGRADPVYDRDLDGIKFGDMPWMLVANGRTGRLRKILPHAKQYEFTPLARLYAFGADAYGLINQLSRLSLGGGGRYNGLTGELSLKRDDVIHRQLVWARFTRGLPQLADTFLPYRGLFLKTQRAATPAAASPSTTYPAIPIALP